MTLPLDAAEIKRRLQVIADCGSITKAAAMLGMPRTTLASTVGMVPRPLPALGAQHAGRLDMDIEDGVVLVGSDAHIWPGDPAPAMRAFVQACEHFRRDLRAVILNGDVFDGATVSRHPSIGWEHKPSVIEELGAVQAQLREIVRAAGPDARRIWTLGNHDQRFETRIANAVPEYQNVRGVHLKDHIPDWESAWSCWINEQCVVKHRNRSGVHATWNNAIYAGKTIVTGHLHALCVRPFTDYNGTRFGVDTGTLATPYGPQFIDYTEGNPVQWRAGFAVLTWRNGRLLWPEVVHVISETEAEFRGRVYAI